MRIPDWNSSMTCMKGQVEVRGKGKRFSSTSNVEQAGLLLPVGS